MSEIQKRQETIIEDFSLFEDWMTKYEFIIDLGKKLSPLEDKFKTEENLVYGCSSPAWIIAEYKDGKLFYKGDGEAIITKGLLYLLFNVINGHSPKEIYEADITFVNDIGLINHLSPTRSNGLMSMIHKVKEIAKKCIKEDL